MKNTLASAIFAAVLMTSAAAIATVMTPTERLVDLLPKMNIDASIPKKFGVWVMDEMPVAGVVNPQQTEVLEKIYSQIVTRTYVNPEGYRIMLSIAYGEDQRDGNSLHYPEVCYPAQGFQVVSNRRGELDAGIGVIPVKRLEAHYGKVRFEPITYWTTVGEKAHAGGVTKKLAEMQYGLRGEVPDGLLFRVSSIDRDSAKAFEMQSRFISDLVKEIDPAFRSRIAGV